MSDNYTNLWKRSLNEPEAFWAGAAEGIDWIRPYDTVLDDSNKPVYRWFVGGELNTCYNAVDRHVEAGRGDDAALIFDSAMTGTKKTLTFAELRSETARFAGALAGLGVGKGDRVIIYMPMVPEAAIAMLACARLGAVHSVVFGGFAANELATRIDDAGPKVIVSASCGLEPGRIVEYKPLLDAAIDQATHKPVACIVLQRPECPADMTDRDHDWVELVDAAAPHACVPVAATDPLYILYTSGTTGQPKGIVRDNGGHAVALHWTMHAIYGVDAGDVFWAASDVGWVVGHSYIVYGPLLRGCATVMFEGKPVGTPDAGEFWRVIADYGVKAMFTAPTAIRAIRRADPDGALLKKLSAATRKHCIGQNNNSACRSSITGGRPRPAGQSPATRSVLACSIFAPARRDARCPAGMCKCSMTKAGRPHPANPVPSFVACRCRPVLHRRSGMHSSVITRRISNASPVSTRPAMLVSSTRTVTCSS